MKISREELERLNPAELARLAAVLEQIEADQAAGKVLWLCDRPECDGAPHSGRPGRHARRGQRPPPGEWDTWLLLAGRGFGKTRTGSEWSWRMAERYERGALIGPTAADTRDILIEGESGILACAPARFRPLYEPSKRRLTYPNGAIQMAYSADEPDRLRGPQHHYGWADELAAWRRLQYAWDMFQMGLRLGPHPRSVVTTTPRPLPLVKELLKSERSAVTRGTTYDNLDNLAPTFRRAVVERYEGTTLGRQELDAEILDDLPGALLKRSVLDRNRIEPAALPGLLLRAVSMDPAGTGLGDETGLIAGAWGVDGHAYVTHDRSDRLSPEAAATAAWQLFEETDSDILVYEDNFGKGWVKEVLQRVWESRLPGRKERGELAPLQEIHASAGKQLRAQPTVMRHEQGLIHHVGHFLELEDQYTTWMPNEPAQRMKSPDRVDAAVHLDAFFVKRFVTHTANLGRTRQPGRYPPSASTHPLMRPRTG